MTDENWQNFPEMDNEPFQPERTSPQIVVTSWEAQAVYEIINDEIDEIYHLAICRSSGLCPVCYTETSSWENEIKDEPLEITDFCPHCGWESDPYYV